jgi:hypothetical protein
LPVRALPPCLKLICEHRIDFHGGYIRFSYANSLSNIMEAIERINRVSARWEARTDSRSGQEAASIINLYLVSKLDHTFGVSGSNRQIAELLGLDPHTVAKGRPQLLAQDVETDRVRAVGGGRKPVEKKRPR